MANTTENSARTSYYGVNAVPQVQIDGLIDAGYSGPWEDWILARQAVESPLTISLTGQLLGESSGEITAEIVNTGAAPVSGKLRFVLMEDDLTHAGSTYHHVMRDFIGGGTAGEAITVGAGQTLVRTEPFTLAHSWTRRNLVALAFVQDDATKEIFQTGRVYFELDEPELVVLARTVDDALGGDGSGTADPGESFGLVYELANLNPTAAAGLSGTLASASPFLDIPDGAATWPDIAPGGSADNASDPFGLELDAAVPWGLELPLTLALSAGTYAKSLALLLPVGSPTSPIGPDAYGYYAYEDCDDYAPAPVFNWVEIDPNLGGSGTLVPLSDDQTLRFDMPFPFQYYGQTFTRVSICSNGWIAMGETTIQSASNGPIPSPIGPPNMIAAFWADLNPAAPGSGKVYQRYDAVGHRYIVEFSGVEHYDANGLGPPETFQFILYDPAYYPTPTGDGEILLQYSLVSQTDGCVVGIEDQTETIGIQYQAYGAVNAAAAGIQAGRAIKFTTVDPQAAGTQEPSHARAALLLARPNPAPAGARIHFDLPAGGAAALRIFGPDGALVRTLLQGRLPAGPGAVAWDGRDDRGRDLPAGVYFYRLNTPDIEVARKIVKP